MENKQLANEICLSANYDSPIEKWLWVRYTFCVTKKGYDWPVNAAWYIGTTIYDLTYHITEIGSTILDRVCFECKSTNIKNPFSRQPILLTKAEEWEVYETLAELIENRFLELL